MPRAVSPAIPPLWKRLRDVLGLKARGASSTDIANAVQGGLDLAILDRLVEMGFERRELFDLVIPQRTLTHRKNRAELLSAEESDRVVRLIRISTLAERVFGTRDKAWGWLRRATRMFDGKAPIALLGTEAGAREVEDELIRIDEGMFV